MFVVRPEFYFLQLYRLGYLEMHSREIGEGFVMFNRLRLEVKSRAVGRGAIKWFSGYGHMT